MYRTIVRTELTLRLPKLEHHHTPRDNDTESDDHLSMDVDSLLSDDVILPGTVSSDIFLI